eukprot:4042994-Amphidinium_carterae.1
MKVAVSLTKCATMGSSDSDGYIPIELEDVKSLADKASDDEISRLEKKLARIKTARTNKTASSTDSDQSVAKMRRSVSDEELRQFAAQLPSSPPNFHARKVWSTWLYQVPLEP